MMWIAAYGKSARWFVMKNGSLYQINDYCFGYRRNRMSRLENGFVYLWALFAVVLAGIVMAGGCRCGKQNLSEKKKCN